MFRIFITNSDFHPQNLPKFSNNQACIHIFKQRVFLLLTVYLDGVPQPRHDQGTKEHQRTKKSLRARFGGFTPIDASSNEAHDIALEAVRAMEAAEMISPDNYLDLYLDVEEASKQVCDCKLEQK